MSGFPAFPRSNMCFPNEMDLYRTTSPFTEGPFLMDSDDIKDGFFPSADSNEQGQAAIVSENNVTPQFVQEMTAFWDNNANGILESDEKTAFTYNVKIFISKDASYLKQAFEKLESADTDVCFFLEDNSTDILSDRAAYVKIGSAFQSSLRDKKIISIIETKSEFFNRYQSSTFNGETFTLDFTAPEIAELIQTGQIINPGMTVIIALYKALNFQTILLTPVYSILYEGLNWITEKARAYLEFQDHQWDPEAQKGGVPNENFQPAIISFFGNISDISEQSADKTVQAIKNMIDNQEQELRSKINTLLNPPVPDFAWPESLNKFVQSAIDSISKLKEYLYQSIDGVVNFMLYIGEKWLNAVNAFYCGIWNSVVEIFVGFIDMIKYVFLLLSSIGEAVSNAQTLVPEMLETIDEFIQLLTSGNFFDTLIAAIKKIAEKIPSINLWSLTNSISIERAAYFLGNIGGFIVELILEAFYSGGTKDVITLINKFGTVGSNISEAFYTAIKGFVKSPTGFTAEKITACTRFIINLLKQGKQKVLQWIDDFWNLLVQAAKLGEDILARIREIFSYTEEQVENLRKYGLDFVKFIDEAAGAECSLCRILSP